MWTCYQGTLLTAKWFSFIIKIYLNAPHSVSFMWESYPASLLNVVTHSCLNNARRGTWGLPPQIKLVNRHITFTVSVRGKTQLTKCVVIKTWRHGGDKSTYQINFISTFEIIFPLRVLSNINKNTLSISFW